MRPANPAVARAGRRPAARARAAVAARRTGGGSTGGASTGGATGGSETGGSAGSMSGGSGGSGGVDTTPDVRSRHGACVEARPTRTAPRRLATTARCASRRAAARSRGFVTDTDHGNVCGWGGTTSTTTTRSTAKSPATSTARAPTSRRTASTTTPPKTSARACARPSECGLIGNATQELVALHRRKLRVGLFRDLIRSARVIDSPPTRNGAR